MIHFDAFRVRPAFAAVMACPGWPRPSEVGALDDVELVRLVAEAEAVGRRIDALRAAAAGEVAERSARGLGPAGLAQRLGCRTAVELLQRVTGAAGCTVNRWIRLGRATRTTTSLTGAVIPPRFAAVAAALDDGTIGVDAAAAVVDTLTPAVSVAGLTAVAAAEGEIVAGAAGKDRLQAPPLDADSVRLQSKVWQVALDPDGAEPSEHDEARRGLRMSAPRHGLVPVSGMLLPEVAAAFQTYVDACTNPRTRQLPGPEDARATGAGATGAGAAQCDAGLPVPGAGVPVAAAPAAGVPSQRDACGSADAIGFEAADPRTGAQKAHDVFAALLGAAARAADAPSVAGNPPTLVVAVRQQDLVAGRGAAWAENGLPVSIRGARQIGCAGAVQRVVLGENGRILQLESPERCFTGVQRRAIALRDGGCIITGCHVPAAWCEIHHVTGRAHDGPTHPDNGVTLCWHHHRTIDTSGWEIRFVKGLPEIKAPPWLDPGGRWRQAIGSPARITARVTATAARDVR